MYVILPQKFLLAGIASEPPHNPLICGVSGALGGRI
jgi:hypothetical protein